MIYNMFICNLLAHFFLGVFLAYFFMEMPNREYDIRVLICAIFCGLMFISSAIERQTIIIKNEDEEE